MAYSMKQAGEATERTKPAILRAIQTGKISAKKNELEECEIEPVELHRVYPPVTGGITRTVTPDEEPAVELLILREAFTTKEEQLDTLQHERREKDLQLTALLADQRKKETEEGASPWAASRWFSWLHALQRR